MNFIRGLLPSDLRFGSILCVAGVTAAAAASFYYLTRRTAVNPIQEEHHTLEEERQAIAEITVKPEEVSEGVLEDGGVNSPQEDQTTTLIMLDEAAETPSQLDTDLVPETEDHEHRPLEEERQASEAEEPEEPCESVTDMVVVDGGVHSPHEEDQTTTLIMLDEAAETPSQLDTDLVPETEDHDHRPLEEERQASEAEEPEELCGSGIDMVVEDGGVNTPHEEDQTTAIDLAETNAKEDENPSTPKLKKNICKGTQGHGEKIFIRPHIGGQERTGPTVWILGDDCILSGEEMAKMSLAPTLGLHAEVTWFGWDGLKWSGFMHFFCTVRQKKGKVPDVLVIHCGGNDLGETSDGRLISDMKRDLWRLHQRFPQIKIVFSAINQQRWWRAGPPQVISPSLQYVNHMMADFVRHIKGCFVPHPGIVSNDPRLFLRDDIHLSYMGNIIFLHDIAECLRYLFR